MKKFISILISVILLAGCTDTHLELNSSSQDSSSFIVPDNSDSTDKSDSIDNSENTENSDDTPQTVSVNLVCAGDNLIHSPIYKQASRRTGGDGYDFRPVYEDVKDIVSTADLAILNQETIVTDEFEPSNYPTFCTPEDCGDQMVEMGFDAVSVSNNHLLDKGEKGLKATLKYWAEKHPEIILYGASEKENKDDIPTAEINGITFAFLGFMEHTNGLSLPSNSEVTITYLKEKERVKALVEKADEIADVVVVSAHYGVEVLDSVSDDQKQITKELVSWGADIIIGTQPHTVQPMEWVTKPDGGEAFVFYCLGNFVSAMDIPLGMLGIVGKITITKDLKTGDTMLSNPDAVPIVTHYDSGYSNIKIYRFENYTKELGEKHGCPYFDYSFAEKQFEKVVKIVDYLP